MKRQNGRKESGKRTFPSLLSFPPVPFPFCPRFEKYEDLRKMLQKTETVFQRKVARVDISATIVFRQRGKRGRSGTACRELLTPVKEKQSEPL